MVWCPLNRGVCLKEVYAIRGITVSDFQYAVQRFRRLAQVACTQVISDTLCTEKILVCGDEVRYFCDSCKIVCDIDIYVTNDNYPISFPHTRLYENDMCLCNVR